MTKQELRDAFSLKIHMNWNDYEASIRQLSTGEIIGKAEEIAAAKVCCDQLAHGGVREADMEYLLKFENPLEVVRDQFMEDMDVEYGIGFDELLWRIRDTQDAEQDYPLDRGMQLC